MVYVVHAIRSSVDNDFAGVVVTPPAAQARDPLLQPYANDSIWNTPIGASATRVPASLATTTGAAGKITVDPIFITIDATAPLKTATPATTVLSGDGTTTRTVTPSWSGSVQVRVKPTMAHNGAYNGLFVALTSSGTSVVQGQPVYLTAGGDPSYAYAKPKVSPWDSITGPGLQGMHAGSGMTAFGGCLREWEWSDPTAVIQHVLSMNLYSIRFLSRTTSTGAQPSPGNPGGFRSPATTADSAYNTPSDTNTYYNGTNPAVKMGTLLALPLNYDMSQITNPKVKRIAQALHDYGAYVVDGTGRDVHAFSVEYTIEAAFTGAGATFHSELMACIVALEVIDDNSLTNPGGAGTRLVTPWLL